MSKLFCISLILLVIFAVVLCADPKDTKKASTPKKIGISTQTKKEKKDSYEEDFEDDKNNGYKAPHEPRPSEEPHKPEKPHHDDYDKAYGDDSSDDDDSEDDSEYNKPKKHKIVKIPSQKLFRVCHFVEDGCTGEPSCFLVENSKCFSFPSGDSMIVDLIGKRGNALYYSGNAACDQVIPSVASTQNAVNPTIVLGVEEEDSCFTLGNNQGTLRILPLFYEHKK